MIGRRRMEEERVTLVANKVAALSKELAQYRVTQIGLLIEDM